MPLKLLNKVLTTVFFHSIIDNYTENGVNCAFFTPIIITVLLYQNKMRFATYCRILIKTLPGVLINMDILNGGLSW